MSKGTMGGDMEHCQALLEKVEGTRADASVDQKTVASTNRLGEKLIAQGRSSKDEVQRQLSELNQALVMHQSSKKTKSYLILSVLSIRWNFLLLQKKATSKFILV